MIVNGVFLMASYNQMSERALATLAMPPASPPGQPWRVLVGGLGMGFTLQEVLGNPRVGAVDLVEIEPSVVRWNRGLLADLNGGCLDDPRVRVVTGDLVEAVRSLTGPYDAICLDVDNGPGWLSLDANRWLYTLTGLERIRGVLAEGGRLAIWSAAASPRLASRLRRLFLLVERHAVHQTDPWGRQLTASIYVAAGALKAA